MSNRKCHGGFTLVEVVIVIAILGILAAIAIPRFITLDDEAHDAVARATHGGFASGVNILHAEWQARGSSSVAVSPTGWPIGAGAPPVNNADCLVIWTDVLTSPEDYVSVRETMVAAGFEPEQDEVTMRAENTTPLDRNDAEKMIRLIDVLEELDDVQEVYSNADISAEILAEL